MRQRVLPVALFSVLLPAITLARGWTPRDWSSIGTLQLRTTRAGEGEHWFPVWLVVVDDQVYIRLGTRAASRIEANATAPWVGVRVGSQQFERVKAVPAPEATGRVAEVIAGKYWSDVVVRHFSHPLTLRLVPAADEGQTP